MRVLWFFGLKDKIQKEGQHREPEGKNIPSEYLPCTNSLLNLHAKLFIDGKMN